MKKELKEKLANVQELMNAVIGNTGNISRSETIEFCEEIECFAQETIAAMKEDEKREGAEE